MPELVSAIIPTYNRAALLARALESVIAQDHRPLEAVVIDDGSMDNTWEVITALQKKMAEAGVGLTVHRQQNGRAPRARNVGMKLAGGSLLAFLDSDDLWRPTLAGTLAGLLERHPGAGLAFCGMMVIDGSDRVWDVRNAGLRDFPKQGVLRTPFEAIVRHMPMQTSGVMIRKSVVEELGDFDLNLPVVEDWDLWYRVAKKYDFAYTQDLLACNRSHPDNLPKYDLRALSSSVKLNLKHLPDVRDGHTREMLVERIERQFTLLQEELLREGKANNGYSGLMADELAPRSPRFELGQMISRGPEWVGQSYGWLVRILGDLKRGIGC
jgi:glycosyltransferase involved in cell wall biosynthesis